MEVSKLIFKGTPEEFPAVAALFDNLGLDGGAITQPTTSLPNIPDGTNTELIRRVLKRMEVPEGQIALYKAFAKVGEKLLSASALAAAMGRTEQELAGVLGALGRRVNGTEGIDQTKPPGKSLFLDYIRSDGEWHYRLRPEARVVLEQEGLI